MSDREAFEKWFLDTQGYDPFSKSLNQESEERAMTAWEAWQAAQAQTLLEVIRDDSGCPTEVRIAEAVQHAGQGEAAAWHTEDPLTDKSATTYKADIADMWRKKGWPVTPLYYATSQPAVPDGWIKVMQGMAEYAECNDPRNPYLQQAQALLRAGKETDK